MHCSIAILLIALLFAQTGCKPDVGACPECYNPTVIAFFDPQQGVIPMPNDLVRGEGKLSIPLSVKTGNGKEVRLYPAAMEEFVVEYLNTLDGFPPETPISFDFYSPNPDTLFPDISTIGPSSVKVFDVTEVLASDGSDLPQFSEEMEVKGLIFPQSFDPVESATGTRLLRITIKPTIPWAAGRTYAVFVLTSAKDSSGKPIASFMLFNYLKSKEPLVAASRKVGDERLVAVIPTDDETAIALEQARLALKPIFDYFESELPESKRISRSNVALAWTFTVAKGSEFVFDLERGEIPTPHDLFLSQLHDAQGLRALLPEGADCGEPESIDNLEEDLRARAAFLCWLASLDGFSATSVASAKFTKALDPDSVKRAETVYIVDISGPSGSVVDFSLEVIEGEVRMKPKTFWQPGHRYAVVFVGDIRANDASPAYSSSAMAMLKLDRPLYDLLLDRNGEPILDEHGQPKKGSMLPGLLSDSEALALEIVRLEYSRLFDIFASLNIPKDKVIGLYTFTVSSANEALFDPQIPIIPFPNDLLFKDPEKPSKGLALPISPQDPAPLQAVLNGLNALDGFSPLESISALFSRPLDYQSLTLCEDATFADLADALSRIPSMVKDAAIVVADITEVDTKDPSTLARLKLLGPQMLEAKAPQVGLALWPKIGRPLEPGRRYMVVLTNRLRSAFTPQGVEPPITVSPAFFFARSKYPLVRNFPCPEDKSKTCYATNLEGILSDEDAQALEALRLAYRPIFDAFELLGVPRESVVLFFTFRTLTVAEEMRSLIKELSGTQAKPLLWGGSLVAASDPQAKALFKGHETQGIAKVCLDCAFIGRVLLGEPDPQNPIPKQFQYDENGSPKFSDDVKLPFFFVLPEGSGPFPVVVFQHGLGGSRLDLVKIASALAKEGLASIAIDAPLHGDHPIRIQNTPSGTGFFTPDVLAVRDNLREAVLDQYQLTRFIKEVLPGFLAKELGLEPGAPSLVDVEQIAYLGVSLGGIIGAVSTALNENLRKAALVVAGGHLMRIFTETQNADFRKPLETALEALGIEPNSQAYEQFISFAQWALDRADPVNFARLAALPDLGVSERFLFIEAKDDDFIPNSTTEELVEALSLADGSRPMLRVYPEGQGSLCHGFFLDGCPPSLYPSLDQGIVAAAQGKAQSDAIAFLKGK